LAARVDLGDLDLDLLTDRQHVLDALHPLAADHLADLRDVQQAVLARDQGDEGAEGRRLDDGSHVALADLGHRRVGDGVDRRAAGAWVSAWASTDAGMPSSLVSSWIAVTNSLVPATLKSMSPNASSAPRMSVSAAYRVCPSTVSLTRPMAMPATGARSGTPALSSDSVDAQTDPMDVDPFELSASDTCRIA